MIAIVHVATNEDNEDAQNYSYTRNLILLLNCLTSKIQIHYQCMNSSFVLLKYFHLKTIRLNNLYAKIFLPDYEILNIVITRT